MIKKKHVKAVLRLIGLDTVVVQWWVRYLKWRIRHRLQRNGMNVLDRAHRCLREHDIACFVDYGTLLGLVREGHLLPHDLDLDMGVLVGSASENIRALTRRALLAAGFQIRRELYLNDRVVEETYSLKKINMDIFYYEVEQTQTKTWLFYGVKGKVYRPGRADVVELIHQTPGTPVERSIDGLTVCLPADSDQWLVEKYGENWRIPDTGWVYWKGPCASPISQQGIVVNHSG